MKKILASALLVSMLLSFAGCGNAQENVSSVSDPAVSVPSETVSLGLDFLPQTFIYSSGAGGWGTEMTIEPDGTFTGQYHDSEMGSVGEEYPYGSYYICTFSGRFTDLSQLNEYSYSMKLTELEIVEAPGAEWIEDGIKYIAAEPYGLLGGNDFILYTPETPVAELPEIFLLWWPMRYEAPETLSAYGIFNPAEETGFFTYQ